MGRNEYLSITTYIVKKLEIILLVGLIGMILFGAFTFFAVTPVYESTATLYISKIDDTYGYLNTDEFNVYNRMIADSEDIMKSREVYNYLTDSVGFDGDYDSFVKSATLEKKVDSNVFYIKFTAKSATAAALYTNTFSKKVIEIMEREFVQAKVDVISTAEPEDKPSEPSIILNSIIGFLTGVLLCLAIIVLDYIFSNLIKTEDDLTKLTKKKALIHLPKKSKLFYKYLESAKNHTKYKTYRLTSSLNNRLIKRFKRKANRVLVFCATNKSIEYYTVPMIMANDMSEKGEKTIVLNFGKISSKLYEGYCTVTKESVGHDLSKFDFSNFENSDDKLLLLDLYDENNPINFKNYTYVIELVEKNNQFKNIFVLPGYASENDNSILLDKVNDLLVVLVVEGKTGKEALTSFYAYIEEVQKEKAEVIYIK